MAHDSRNTTSPHGGSGGHQQQFHNNLQHQQLGHFQNLLLSKPSPVPVPVPRKPSAPSTDDPLQSPRQLLPVLVCLLTFATVLSVLVIYKDTSEIRHQQFRLNMTRDFELVGVSQDDPDLINFVRDIYLRRQANARFAPHAHASHRLWDFHGRQELTPRMAQYVVDSLLGGKRGGVFVQSLPGGTERLLTAPWLVGGAQWTGLVVEPDLRKYFELRKEFSAQKGMQIAHACVSPTEYPKEVHVEVQAREVQVNSLHDNVAEEADDTETVRVKCFSLFTILLATNRTTLDLLSVGVRGHQLEILQTLPFDRVRIQVISVHFGQEEGELEEQATVGNISRLLYEKGFEFVKKMEQSYFYKAIAKQADEERHQEEVVEQAGGL